MGIKDITVEFPLKIGPQGNFVPITEDNVGEAIKFNLKMILLRYRAKNYQIRSLALV